MGRPTWLLLAIPILLGAAAPSADAVRAEVRGFYRDLASGDWTALVGHFLPAKISTEAGLPAAFAGRTPEGRADGEMVVETAGEWAYVEAGRAGGTDVLLLRRYEERWRIAALRLGTARRAAEREPGAWQPAEDRSSDERWVASPGDRPPDRPREKLN